MDAVHALGAAVERYQAAVDDFDREAARVLGVNETDLRCLEILIREPVEVTPRLLAQRLNLTTGSVTAMLDRLEKLNYVRRVSHPSDRRRIIVEASAAAVKRAADLFGPLVTEGNELLRRHYTIEQVDVITDFLTRTTELQQRHVDRLRQT
jgi:DNA-binding MarR family transcriptional regulator